MAKRTEQDIAAQVVEWLSGGEWEIYQEVQPSRNERVADIVAVRGSVYWIIETKRSLSISVLEQAWSWSGHSHLRSVAVPALKRSNNPFRGTNFRPRRFAQTVAKEFGIGVITINDGWID